MNPPLIWTCLDPFSTWLHGVKFPEKKSCAHKTHTSLGLESFMDASLIIYSNLYKYFHGLLFINHWGRLLTIHRLTTRDVFGHLNRRLYMFDSQLFRSTLGEYQTHENHLWISWLQPSIQVKGAGTFIQHVIEVCICPSSLLHYLRYVKLLTAILFDLLLTSHHLDLSGFLFVSVLNAL